MFRGDLYRSTFFNVGDRNLLAALPEGCLWCELKSEFTTSSSVTATSHTVVLRHACSFYIPMQGDRLRINFNNLTGRTNCSEGRSSKY